MPRIIKKRQEKRSVSDEDIRETVTDIRERLKDKQRTLVYGLSAFLVVVGAIVAFTVYTKSAETKAQELEQEGQKIFYGMSSTPFAAPADRYKSALEQFKKAYEIKKRPATLLLIADCQFSMGAFDDAIKTLTELNSRHSATELLSLSYFKLASAYLAKGDKDNALKAYNSLSTIKDGALRDLALMESARLLETMGKTDEAAAKRKELAEKFPAAVSQAGSATATAPAAQADNKTGK